MSCEWLLQSPSEVIPLHCQLFNSQTVISSTSVITVHKHRLKSLGHERRAGQAHSVSLCCYVWLYCLVTLFKNKKFKQTYYYKNFTNHITDYAKRKPLLLSHYTNGLAETHFISSQSIRRNQLKHRYHRTSADCLRSSPTLRFTTNTYIIRLNCSKLNNIKIIQSKLLGRDATNVCLYNTINN